VVPAEDDRQRARLDDLSDRRLDRLVRAGGVRRGDGRIAEVDDAKRGERVDARFEVAPRRAARRPNRTGPVPRPRPVGDEVVGRRAHDRDIRALELGGVLRVRLAAVGQEPREVGLLAVLPPTLERIDHRGEIMTAWPGSTISRDCR
jgi:hypothetical protein